MFYGLELVSATEIHIQTFNFELMQHKFNVCFEWMVCAERVTYVAVLEALGLPQDGTEV